MKDLSLIEAKIKEYEERIKMLKELENELNSLNVEGFEEYVNAIRKKLKDPKRLEEVKKDIELLKAKIKKRREIIGIEELKKLFEYARKKFEEGNYVLALQYITRWKEFIEKAKPKLRVEFSNTSFTLNRWEKAEMYVVNEGVAIARDIKFEFSKVTVRNLPEIEVEPKSRKKVEFHLKPNSTGDVPVEVKIRCKDHLNR